MCHCEISHLSTYYIILFSINVLHITVELRGNKSSIKVPCVQLKPNRGSYRVKCHKKSNSLYDQEALKGQFSPKSKIHIFSLTFTAIHQSKLFWCELPSFGDIGRRDFCLLSNIMGLNGALNVVLTAPKNN